MGAGDGIDPAVRSILDAARERAERQSAGAGGDGRVDVDARSLPGAFAAAEADGRVPVVAEIKPTSPTTEGERADDPVALAREMVAGGAAALSVLTEPEHFGGSTDALARVREAVVAAARDRGFQVLVETHSRGEVERALAAGADIVGVNNRDLARLEVDLATFERVAPEARRLARERAGSVTLIAESGIRTTNDVARMREAGADALLVGSAIMDGAVRENTRRLATAAGPEDGAATDRTTDDSQS
ncbi:indole-3-glycerol phosphate synthase [Halobacteriales archaeon QH_8_68_33]|nr:MAG: indole-3-glycerol phosphate synthase [Halobacteriales archaeon QH_8_68_33]